MAFKDMREWISLLECEGELHRVKAPVDWDLEIGAITQKVFDTGGPALLFENIKGYEKGCCTSLFTASLSNYARIALMLGVVKDTSQQELVNL